MISRRNFCALLGSAVAAPYVIRNSGVLMPVRDRSLRLVYAINANEYVINGRGNIYIVPLGLICPFLGKPPKGWLPFDGRIIRQEEHPELFKVANWGGFDHMRLEEPQFLG